MANLSAYFIRELVFIGNNKNKMSAWNCNKAKKTLSETYKYRMSQMTNLLKFIVDPFGTGGEIFWLSVSTTQDT